MSAAGLPNAARGLLPRFTLKDGDTFLLADALGDIQGSNDGLFSNDTRMLSRLELELAGRQPSLLGAAVSQDNTLFTAHLTNQPLPALGERAIPKEVIHIERNRFLWKSRLYERVRLTNFSGEAAQVPLRLCFAADFADIFEVQGLARKQRGTSLEPEVSETSVRLSYRGLDRKLRSTAVRFGTAPDVLSSQEACFTLDLPRGDVAELYFEIGANGTSCPSAERFEAGLRSLSTSMQHRLRQGAHISSSGRLFEEWVQRSRADLALLTTALATGPYPYAGIPWFATQFGRDAIITALQMLWLDPGIAAGVLRFLASTQADQDSAFRDSEPGKILHEMRRGEMAALDEVPFRRYYGSVDTTPLFVMLAGAYEERTGDAALVAEIWENLLAAMSWIEHRLDASDSGFLDYARGATSGLANQGWKDSHDSISHADGSLPRGSRWRHSRLSVANRTEVWPGVPGLSSCAPLLSSASGSSPSATTRWRSMVMASAVQCALRTPDTCCTAVCRAQSTPRGWPNSFFRPTSRRDGASAHSRIARRATTPCHITMAPSGLTIPLCVRRGSRATWGATA